MHKPIQPLATKVCTHLAEVVTYLDTQGCEFFWPVIPDRHDGHILVSFSAIDFDLLSQRFDLPSYVLISPEGGQISCAQCWCRIETYQPDKVYAASIQPQRR